MIFILIGLTIAAAITAYVYFVREALGRTGLGLAGLRMVALSLLVVLAANPSWLGRPAGPPPTILLDRSLSMGAPGGSWNLALDSARRLAGPDGPVLGFGARVGRIGDAVPADGASRLSDALAAARATGGPVYVLTDGEIADAALLDSSSLAGVTVVVLPRDTAPGAALVRASVPAAVHRGDTLDVTVGIATWGALAAESTVVEVLVDGRRMLSRTMELPAAPALVTRTFRVPSGTLATGDRIVEVRQQTPGDADPEDDVRVRVATVTADPPITLVADPASWDARYVYETLVSVGGLPVQGFARIAEDRYVDMATGGAVQADAVRRAVRGAALVVLVGATPTMEAIADRGAWWWWRQDERSAGGDWYLDRAVSSSPLVGSLSRIAWDSVPPLEALATTDVGARTAVLAARLGRRGAALPVLVAGEEAGRRSLETLGVGVYRWGLRGGAGAEALRTVVASGVDWLLRSNRSGPGRLLTATTAVTRGNPISFRWHGEEPRDSLRVALSSNGTVRDTVVRFGPEGVAELTVPVGVYRWTADEVGASGTTVVETYSDELPPAPVWAPGPPVPAEGRAGVLGHMRDRWWMFLLVIGVLAAEWAWRQRRGLP